MKTLLSLTNRLSMEKYIIESILYNYQVSKLERRDTLGLFGLVVQTAQILY